MTAATNSSETALLFPIVSASGVTRSAPRSALSEMKRISKVLEFPVIVEGGRSFLRESHLLEKLDFLRGRVASQQGILKEGVEP